MTLALYDSSTGTKRPYSPGQHDGVECVPPAGVSAALADVRQAVITNLVARLTGTARHDDASLARLLTAATDHAFEPEAVRYWALSLHYRDAGEGTAADADPRAACETRVTELAATAQRLRTLPAERIVPVQTAPASTLAGFPSSLRGRLEDDLDTPRALLALDGFLSAVNALCDTALSKKGQVNASAIAAAEVGFEASEALLGLGFARPEAFLRRVRDRRARERNIDRADVEARIARRAALRAAKDFTAADQLQDELLALGVRLHDGPAGTSWTLV